MRHTGLALTALVLAVTAAAAQQQDPQRPAQPAAAPADPRLDAYLTRWEQEMQRVQTLYAQLVRLDNDKSFGNVQKLVGSAQYMKVGSGATAQNLAVLQLSLDGKADIAEKYVCTGTYIYQFAPAQKEIKVIELPKAQPGHASEEDSGFLSFLFGMKAQDAKKRYDLRFLKEDDHFVYVLITPRYAEDRRDFTKARLVLNKDSYLPRQLWFEQPNGNEVTWDIPQLKNGINLNRAAFDRPELPPGWKFNMVPRQQAQPYKTRQ